MKETKQHGTFSWLTGGGTYKEAKFEEDADAVVAHYRNEGYIEARVGTPELKTLEDSHRRQDALDPGARPGHRRGRATGSASSTSTATRWSRPRGCGRSSS